MRKRTELSRAVTCVLMIGLSAHGLFFLKNKVAFPGIHFSPWMEFFPGEAFLKSEQVWKRYFSANF